MHDTGLRIIHYSTMSKVVHAYFSAKCHQLKSALNTRIKTSLNVLSRFGALQSPLVLERVEKSMNLAAQRKIVKFDSMIGPLDSKVDLQTDNTALTVMLSSIKLVIKFLQRVVNKRWPKF
ncbi:unnamed protein product [Arabis nemorensis]|uniref:Uncharacterized protein n=1 Tax=Arabis nemorensis TaxID=586526 RepID=A0A565CB04_9BRAS|nr:unnamed protein product [Arabis nemorensis]